ncbi:MAG: hypothetical protein R3B57_11585 [Phycisphaerales bacterium]
MLSIAVNKLQSAFWARRVAFYVERNANRYSLRSWLLAFAGVALAVAISIPLGITMTAMEAPPALTMTVLIILIFLIAFTSQLPTIHEEARLRKKWLSPKPPAELKELRMREPRYERAWQRWGKRVKSPSLSASVLMDIDFDETDAPPPDQPQGHHP